MNQACENVLFANEALSEMRAAGPGVRKLESHRTLEETVGAFRQPDLTHAPAAKQFEELVGSAQGILGKRLALFQDGCNLAADQRAPRILRLIARQQSFHFEAYLGSGRVILEITGTLFLIQVHQPMEQPFQLRTKIHGMRSSKEARSRSRQA